MNLHPNDGDRPSLLQLGRLASGELDDAEADALRARLDDQGRATLAEIEAARHQVRPFDATALRQRAADAQPAPSVPAPANRAWLGAFVALAAALLVGLAVALAPSVPPADITFRSGDALSAYVLDGRQLVPWEGQALGDGATVGFQVGATGHRGVVLLSVDPSGAVTTFWPEHGDAPEPLRGDGMVALPGTVVLDAQQGREVFVAVFDHDVPTAEAKVAQAHELGGVDGLLRWADDAEGVAAIAIVRGELR
jgi:hypothetical protein